MNTFKIKKIGIKIVLNELKVLILKKITSRKSDFFLRVRDIISHRPIVSGIHEPELTELINFYSENGFSDFFIDIGANIGISSCQNGSKFKKIICFEPNPLCFNILKVNVDMHLNLQNVEINKFGLGKKDEKLEIMIPKSNWGGGFVLSDSNNYSIDTLAKDGFSSFDKNNYINKKIEIKKTKKILKNNFEILIKNNLNKGIIKIDVEGMEESILEDISEILPKNIKTKIIFENWDINFNIKKIKKLFSSRNNNFYLLKKVNPYIENFPNFLKAILLLFSFRSAKLESIDNNLKSKIGDIVIELT